MRPLHCLCLLLLFAVIAPLAAAAEPATGSLSLQIRGIAPEAGGSLRIALFRGEQGWPKFAQALQVKSLPISSTEAEVAFHALPYGDDYAVEVHHDENANGKFDMRWLPYPRPKEGYGVSNNIIGFGTPDFSDARFAIEQPETNQKIEMHY